jgi:hypothetical protein
MSTVPSNIHSIRQLAYSANLDHMHMVAGYIHTFAPSPQTAEPMTHPRALPASFGL